MYQIKMKEPNKKISESFEPEKFVFLNDWVFSMPKANVNKQILMELKLSIYETKRGIAEELGLQTVAQIENPKKIEERTSYII